LEVKFMVMENTSQPVAEVDQTINKYERDQSALIQMLLENHWLPKEALLHISQKLDIPLPRIYHIATFYKAFSLVPQGRHMVSVCVGTACHVRGASRLVDKVSELLKVGPGETSPDMKFSLSTVSCLGCCALGPVIMVDNDYHSNPSTQEMEPIFSACD
jgi:NADH-quinone oxidoreductase subunit E